MARRRRRRRDALQLFGSAGLADVLCGRLGTRDGGAGWAMRGLDGPHRKRGTGDRHRLEAEPAAERGLVVVGGGVAAHYPQLIDRIGAALPGRVIVGSTRPLGAKSAAAWGMRELLGDGAGAAACRSQRRGEPMPVRTSVVGTPHRATVRTCDARWLMAYSAGLGLADAAYFDTTARRRGRHPLFRSRRMGRDFNRISIDMDSRGPKSPRRPRRTRSGAAPAGPPGRRGFRHRHGRRCRDHVRRARVTVRLEGVDLARTKSRSGARGTSRCTGALRSTEPTCTHPPPPSCFTEIRVRSRRRAPRRAGRCECSPRLHGMRAHLESDHPICRGQRGRPVSHHPARHRHAGARGDVHACHDRRHSEGVRRIAAVARWCRCRTRWRSNSSRATPPPPPRRLVSRCATTQAMSPYATASSRSVADAATD